jgi:hypothetical protein
MALGTQDRHLEFRRFRADVDRHQTVIRTNRDTLYSPALIDLNAGPLTVILPDADNRFRSMQLNRREIPCRRCNLLRQPKRRTRL